MFASFIPYLAGAIGVVSRMFYFPDQVNVETLQRVFAKGVFNNNANHGFQEGYFPPSDEVVRLFHDNGFEKVHLRSIRGWGNNKEEPIYNLQKDNREAFNAIMDLINETADNPAIIETCSHAIYIGRKV